MKNKLFITVFTILIHSSSYAQYASTNLSPNIGFTVSVLGPIFGVYSLGISTFITSNLQVGMTGTYYSTRNLDPQAEGWLAEYRMTYYFSQINKNGIYLALAGGFESVQIKKDSGNWEKYEDPIGGIIPGYHWLLTNNLHLLAGLNFGYQFGTYQITPEIGFVYFL
ncbi:DUF3575 domain-containing protein [Fluviispira multicolorata]|uniref:DUF3575 domain-containing protein n=1 Tax=Fluviispira multicolorata TaxID=2654512 RepID=A0A833N2G9_9BACT|nr:DUF3575 domain-containing protein [Fluviispira multicolorata]KAB8032212.1 DUF3575 domain-containing protein [Fluviispira multicolorata]